MLFWALTLCTLIFLSYRAMFNISKSRLTFHTVRILYSESHVKMDTNTVHTSQKTHYFPSTNTNPLILHGEITDFSFENRMRPATHWAAKVQD